MHSGSASRRRRTPFYHDSSYLAKIADAHQRGVFVRGALGHVDVLHDDDCDLLAGRGYCKCRPDVRVRYAPEVPA